jgi:hypothetical protein
MAAAIGAGLPITASGNMIVDIGGGTTAVTVARDRRAPKIALDGAFHAPDDSEVDSRQRESSMSQLLTAEGSNLFRPLDTAFV